MVHIIMSGPLKPLTEIERAAAQARLNLDGGARALAHGFNLFEEGMQSQSELRREALAEGRMLLCDAIREIGIADNETGRFYLRGCRKQEMYGVTMYLGEDVFRLAQKRKSRRKFSPARI